MTDLKILEHDQFGVMELLQLDNKYFFPAADVAKLLGYRNASAAIKRHCLPDGVIKYMVETPGGHQEKSFITEGNLYRLITKSKLDAAIEFERWVFDHVLPSLRTKGGIVTNAEKFTESLFPHASGETKELLLAIMTSVQEQNAVIAQQQRIINTQQHDLKFNEEVITSLTDDVDFVNKRKLLTQIILKAGVAKARDRWGALYRQFEAIYGVRLSQRLESYNLTHTPKLKNKLDYIHEVMGRFDDLYNIAIRMYEADLEKIKKDIEDLREPSEQLALDFGDAEIH